MFNRWWVDTKTRATNRLGYILFTKPTTPWGRSLHRLAAWFVPTPKVDYMQDDLVDEDIGFDAEELKRYRQSGDKQA